MTYTSPVIFVPTPFSKQREAANLEQVRVLVPWVSEITISPAVLSEQVLHPTLQALSQNVYCPP